MIWAALAAFTLVVLAVLLIPFLRRPQAMADRAAYDLTVFQDQLKEVERDVSRGVLTASEADAARLEIQRRILAASRAPQGAVSTGGSRWGIAAAVAVIVPVVALGVYSQVGTPDLSNARVAAADAPASDAEINKMVEQLAARVASTPDIEGLTLLARTYRQLGRFADAAETYKKLAKLQPDADTYSSLGEALTAERDGQVTPEAHQALVTALALDRTEPRARFYLGLEQAEKGNAREAIAIWRELIASAPTDAPWLEMVREQMAGAAQQANIPPMTVEPKHPFEILPPDETTLARMNAAAMPAPKPQPAAGPLAGESPENVKMIQGMVSGLAERLANNPDDFDGWMMLGRSYAVLKEPQKAGDAYQKAIALKPTEVAPKLQYVALIMTTINPDALAPLPKALTSTVSDILKLDPKQPEALYLAGLDRAKSGDAAGAREFWGRAQAALPANAALRVDIDRRLKALD